uniref:NADH-ubiquinone oxidoreductase chain 2 n=1 Tax=Chaetosoma scaritides TaxID=546502 RepID=B6D8V7_9CUCU|nr:NADH dehydrogenase subunit 2 [Chaetosoma scaritides]ACF35095.1 NADH dehydrogenase subunit 2 [Chaetosoma scaritides]
MKFYKLMFFLLMMSGTLISISSYSWIGMWMGLEINLISIIPLFSKINNMYSSESSIKYFITQALASMIILLSIIMLSLNNEMFLMMKKTFILTMNSSLLTKMGAAPFHFWFPEVIEGLNWMNCLIILTWQKIAPMVLIMYNFNFNLFFCLIILTSMLISMFMGMNQISMRKIMAFSSINHIGWMISTMFSSKSIWLIYFIVYSIISLNIILILNKFKIFFLNQLLLLMNNNNNLKLFFSLNFLSLGGLPPFLGFIPKWLTINELIKSNFIFLSFSMIILTLFTLFYYMRMILSILIINHSNKLNFNFKMNNFLIFSLNLFTISSFLIIPLFFNML